MAFDVSGNVAAAPAGDKERQIVLSLIDVEMCYFKGANKTPVLDGLDLEIEAGSFEALMGPSGSGKTTLLNLIAGLDRPTGGSIRVAGADLGTMDDTQLSAWRARNVGFIFQQYNLIPVLSAAENVELPLLLRRSSRPKNVASELRSRSKRSVSKGAIGIIRVSSRAVRNSAWPSRVRS